MSGNRSTSLQVAALAFLLFAGPVVWAQSVSDSDFVSISSATVGLFGERIITLQISVNTRTPAMAMTFPLSYAGHPKLSIDQAVGTSGVTYDSVGNSPRWNSRTVLVDSANKTILLGFLCFQNPLPPSVGPLATIHFKLDSTDVPAQVTVDSTFIFPANFLSLVDEAALEYIPQFTRGQIDITDQVPKIRFNLSSVSLTAIVDSLDPPPHDVSIINDGAGVLHWQATSDQPWLSVAPDSGTGDATIALSASAAGLSVGTFHGHVRVSDPEASNSPQELPVHFYVLPRPDPADSDYVAVSTVVAPINQPSKTSVDVLIGTTSKLEAMVIPLAYGGSPYLRVDRTAGTNGITWSPLGNDPAWGIKVFNVDSVQKTLLIALIRIASYFTPAEGLLATVHFAVDSTVVPDTIVIDTTFIPPTAHLEFHDSNFTTTIPAFQPGAVILEPFRDSLCISPPTIYLHAIQNEPVPPCATAIGTNCGGITLWGSTTTNPCGTWLSSDAHKQGESLFIDICALSTDLDTGLYVCTLTVSAERMVNPLVQLPVVYRVSAPRAEAASFECDLGVSLLGASLFDEATFGTEASATDGYDAGLDLFKVPPPPGEFVRVSFVHPEWGVLQDEFETDIRAPFADECKVWLFTVESSRPGTVHLAPACRKPAYPLSMRLTDAAGHVLAPDFDVYGYTYPTGGGTQTFALSLCGPGHFTMTYEGGWNLMSSPLEPDDPSLPAVFGADADLYQLYGWNGAYFAPQAFHGCGAAYWLLLPERRSIEFTGTPCGFANNPARIPLRQGWNLIGCPYPAPARLMDAVFDSSGLMLGAPLALDRGWISPALYGWQGGAYRFGHVVAPGFGYWLPVLVEGVDLLLNPYQITPLEAPALPEDVVTVALAGTDVAVRIGVTANATDGFDANHDFPLPPQGPVAAGWWLGIGSDLNPLFKYYYQDLRGEQDSLSWSIAVGHPGPATVRFTGTGALTAKGYVLTFVDPVDSQNTVIDLDMDVVFDRGRFELVAQRQPTGVGEKPEQFYLRANYPNPFNPQTAIQFGLAAPAHVELIIYNVLGQRIRLLTTGDFPAGNHTVFWNGLDDDGRKAASGVYFYRLKAGDFEEAHKMMMLR